MHMLSIDRRPGLTRPRWNVLTPKGDVIKLRDYCRRNGHRYFTVLQALKRQIATGSEADLGVVIRQIAARQARAGGYYSRPSSIKLAEREHTRTVKKRGPKNVAYTPDYSKRPDLVPTGINFVRRANEAVRRDGTTTAHVRWVVPCETGECPLKHWCEQVGVPYGVILKRIERLGAGISRVLETRGANDIVPYEEIIR